MVDVAPDDAQALAEDFMSQQAAEEAARAAAKAEAGGRTKREIAAGQSLKSGRPMTAEEVTELACNKGFKLESGGKHPHLVHEDGRKVSLPKHGGAGRTLAKGTFREIMKVILGKT